MPRIPVITVGLATTLAGALLTLDRAGAATLSWSSCLALVCLVAGCACLATSAPTRAAYTGTLRELTGGRRLPLWSGRALVALSAPLYGAGVGAYAAAALVQALRAPEAGDRVLGWRRSCGTGLVGLAGVLILNQVGVRLGGETVMWSVLLAGAGLSLFWWVPDRRLDPSRVHGERERHLLTWLSVGLAGTGALFLLDRTGLFAQAERLIVGTIGAMAVLALVIGPRWLRSSRALAVERVKRALATERADLGGLLHDSVLQTLALIQDRADDPAEVRALSRRQERELRAWLVGGPVSGDAPRSIANRLRREAAEVEDAYGVKIDVVTVGDAPLAHQAEPLVAAAREALVNAAKHAGGAPISLFCEIDKDTVAAFVRDRGPGIDLDAIPADRHGVRDSILARMKRHGGHAEVRTAPGGGCEVRLTLERAP